MPIKKCSEGDKPGFKWGDSGKCYTYTAGDDASMKAAKAKAVKQALAENKGTMPTHKFAALETVDLDSVEIAAADVTAFGNEGFSD